jgi:hypothetical protein
VGGDEIDITNSHDEGTQGYQSIVKKPPGGKYFLFVGMDHILMASKKRSLNCDWKLWRIKKRFLLRTFFVNQI